MKFANMDEVRTLAEHGIFKGHNLYITPNIITLKIEIKHPQQKSYSLFASPKCTISQLKDKIAAHYKLQWKCIYFKDIIKCRFHRILKFPIFYNSRKIM